MNVVEPDPGATSEIAQSEYVIDSGALLGTLWRHVWVIVLVTVLLAGVVLGFDLLRTPTYEATIKILVGQKQENSDIPSQLGSDVQGLQQLTQTMTEAVGTRPVALGVIDKLNLAQKPEEFLGNLSAEQVAETQFIEVSYEDENPERAAQIANTVGAVFADQVAKVSPSANAITVTVWEKAVPPDSPVSPNPLRDSLLALVLGSILGVGLALLLEQLDDRWRSPEEVEQVTGVPTFGAIPEYKVSRGKKGGS
jgi:capsular polysaccharide biosynthesis protein